MALTAKQRKAALEKGLSVDLAAADDKKYLNPNPVAATQLFAKAPKTNSSIESLPSDGLRLSVCINDYIKQTDIVDLLKILPPAWSIRERTLIEIARSFPTMTSLEFRRSLLLLVEQVTKSKTDIQNHNAWLKAAFAKNEGPLVTQSMIEAHLDHIARIPQVGQTKSLQASINDDIRDDFDALRWYLAANSEDRATIEKAAEEAAASALRIAPTDKHPHIREQALIEASRLFFEKKIKET
jgi:hypothetical protein